MLLAGQLGMGWGQPGILLNSARVDCMPAFAASHRGQVIQYLGTSQLESLEHHANFYLIWDAVQYVDGGKSAHLPHI